MSVGVEVLFGQPQKAIASLIRAKLKHSVATSIVTGFATPGGLDELLEPMRTKPNTVENFVVGASTYPGFQALDNLLAVGVPRDRLAVHLGHTAPSGTRRHPHIRFRPMLHSKVYYMEMPGNEACAFVGSHNVTSYALGGLNGEASVLLTGDSRSPQFDTIRTHIAAARAQSTQYHPSMKEAYSWWFRQYIEGLEAEIKLPQEWQSVRTIVALLQKGGPVPKADETIYFEIPAGIEQIESLRTEVHLFLFPNLPADANAALQATASASSRFRCQVIGVENRQGNQEIAAEWRIDGASKQLAVVAGGTLRPKTPPGQQQIRAVVIDKPLDLFEYAFERERKDWEPVLSSDYVLSTTDTPLLSERARQEAGADRDIDQWQLVTQLRAPSGSVFEADQLALELASPDSGSFVLVALRRREIE